MMTKRPAHPHDDDAWVASWVCALVFAAICVVGVFRSDDRDITSEAFDQNHHHLPVVRAFASDFPRVDLSDYASATAPAWHLVLAGVQAAGASDTGLRLMAVLAGAALIGLCVSVSGRWTGPATATALALPLALSPYALSGSIWITTDVPATLCIAGAIGASLLGATASAGLASWLAVGIRQSSVWVTAPVALLIARTAVLPHGRLRDRVQAVGVAVLPALITLGVLVWLWGGLTPPSYRSLHDRGMNLAGPALFLSLCCCWGLPLGWGALPELLRTPKLLRLAGLGAVAALMLAVIPETAYSTTQGRWGGPLWSLVQAAPSFNGRSLVFILLAPLGVIAVLALHHRAVRCGNRFESLALLLSLLGLMAANAANTQAWERYCDLPLLVLLPWMAALGASGPGVEDRAMAIRLGAVVVAGVQAALSVPMVIAPILRG